MDITYIQKDSWLFERHGPHFLCVGNQEKQKEIEAKILEDTVAVTVERPCMGSCVAIRSEKYPAARGVIYSRRLNFANIYLVDYGISEEFPDSCLSSISSKIMEIPFLAVPCKLATSEPIEPAQVVEIFEKAKLEVDIQIKKVWYRGFFNVVDAFKDTSNQSCLSELLNITKPKKPTTFHVYSKDDILAYKSDKRVKAFINALDQLTYIESQALYKTTRKQK
uniref:Tudor domain-containing protein n=1 Tax=Panagrolaimus sp. ES5 TaxID=591445 RepID=A0AC34FHZ8_9BILA